MRPRGGRAIHGNRSIPKGPGRPTPKAIALLRDEVTRSKEVLMAAIRAYKEALQRYRSAIAARFTGKH